MSRCGFSKKQRENTGIATDWKGVTPVCRNFNSQSQQLRTRKILMMVAAILLSGALNIQAQNNWMERLDNNRLVATARAVSCGCKTTTIQVPTAWGRRK